MEEIIEVAEQAQQQDAGKIVFANDVVATIASLAASEVAGIAGMSGTTVDTITEKFGKKKSITKGIRIDMSVEGRVSVDLSVNVYYGFKIQEVCKNLQNAVKNGIETMTGLEVVAVNVNVQSVVFEKPEETQPAVATEETEE